MSWPLTRQLGEREDVQLLDAGLDSSEFIGDEFGVHAIDHALLLCAGLPRYSRRAIIALVKLQFCARLGFALLFGLTFAQVLRPGGERVLDAGWHHLGNDSTPDWSEASAAPEGTLARVEFDSVANAGEWVLAIGARSVGKAWNLDLGGQRIASLRTCEGLEDHYYPVPPGAVRAGKNTLSVVPEDPADDITVGNIRLIEASLRDVLELGVLEIEVRDAEGGAALPARITVADASGALAELFYAERFETAVRQGVVYTSEGRVRVELPAGSYQVWASRGTEWGLGEARIEIPRGAEQPAHLAFALRREVDTQGFIACDTHIHTLTYSGHGDSSVDERMITLAGEGVELAIATDHNHNTDYRSWQAAHSLQRYYTPVVGNEVTTEVGHFNAFPLDPAAEVPDHKSTDYATLVSGMRAKGAKVVILNHPRWPEHATGPFGVAALDPFTGARGNGMPCPFDATELVNSTTNEPTPMLLFTDWFALLNRGEKVAAVGSSDSHTVGEPVGQGRTYIRSSTDDPAKIDVDEACRNIAAGRSTISMGFFVDAKVDAAAGPGELASVKNGRCELALRVAAAGWLRPERAHIFVNGIERAVIDVPTQAGAPTDVTLSRTLEWPHAHDAWVVCVVTGPAAGPWWPVLNDYTLAATNPILLDGDGDGRYSSPRATAEARARGKRTQEEFATALAGCDPSVAIHVLDLARIAFQERAMLELQSTAGSAGADARVRAWLEALPEVSGK